jgi:hypothetical protein
VKTLSWIPRPHHEAMDAWWALVGLTCIWVVAHVLTVLVDISSVIVSVKTAFCICISAAVAQYVTQWFCRHVWKTIVLLISQAQLCPFVLQNASPTKQRSTCKSRIFPHIPMSSENAPILANQSSSIVRYAARSIKEDIQAQECQSRTMPRKSIHPCQS